MIFTTYAIQITIGIILFCVLLVFLSGKIKNAEIRKAGRKGEKYATEIIRQCICEDDILLSNVSLSFEGKRAELDDLIINRRGIFIIEIKNYSGKIFGDVADNEWTKLKTTDAGNTYKKTVRNPIKQVRREIYILANYLRERQINVWVDGYVFMVNDNSPVDDPSVLSSKNDILNAIHGKPEKLSNRKVQEIAKTLKVCT